MSKSTVLSIASVIEKNRVASDVPFLIALEVAIKDPITSALIETVRLVKNSEDLTINGFLYTAAAFDIELKEEAASQPSITLSVKDFTRSIITKMESYGGGVGFGVIVSVVNAGALSSPPEATLFFEVIGSSAANYVVQFQLGAENPLYRIFPRRVQAKDFCGWKYKDQITCKYAGAIPSCDLTLNGPNGCKAHSNEVRFGAFPGINNAST